MRTPITSRHTLTLICIVSMLIAISAIAANKDWEQARKLTVAVGNRLYPDFKETHKLNMHERAYVGDTDYSFEVTEFYPHFARIDSTKEIVSLSAEPKNVAFKFVVYENDSIVDSSWSFFNLQIPHFAITSYLFFDVLEFEYRGVVFKQEAKE